MRAAIAHLSDLHFGNHDSEVERRLRADLQSDWKPDFIVVTGDLSERQRPWQFLKAKEFLQNIVSDLSDETHSTRVIVIPGNHDVFVLLGRKPWENAFRAWEAGGSKGACRPANLEEFYKNATNSDASTAVRLANKDWSYCEYYPECQLAFLKFDSNKLAPAFWEWIPPLIFSWVFRNYARGQVGEQQMKEMKQVLDRYDQAFPAGTHQPAFQNARKIALVHHHIHYLPNVGSDSIMLMLDAGRFWKSLIDLGVELVLHGHKHFATHAVIRYTVPTEGGGEERELLVLSAGTALSNDQPDGHSYYRLEAEVLSCSVRQRRMQQTNGVAPETGFATAGFADAISPSRARSFFLKLARFMPWSNTKRRPLSQTNELMRFEDDGPMIVFRRNVNIKVPGAKNPIDGAALDAILTPDALDYVDNLDIEEINYEGTIDKDLGYCMNVTYAGRLLRAESYLNVPIVVVNAPARHHTLAPVVIDLLTESHVAINDVTVERHKFNVRKLIIKIALPVANPGDRFKIGLKTHTPAMMYDLDDFDAMGILRYRHGPKQLSYVLRSERELVGVNCFAVHRSGLRSLESSYTRRNGDGLYVVRPVIGSVAALGTGVLCHYRELLPINPAPDRAVRTE
jgi:3',5'-cyclic AMP phosphodiesterase CpdA